MKTFKELLEEFVGEEACAHYFKCIECEKTSDEPYYTGFCSETCAEKYYNEWNKVLENNP